MLNPEPHHCLIKTHQIKIESFIIKTEPHQQSSSHILTNHFRRRIRAKETKNGLKDRQRRRQKNLVLGSTCRTIPSWAWRRSTETGDSRAERGSQRLSSLQRKQIISTVEIFPTHLLLLLPFHTLRYVSHSVLLSAERASLIVEETQNGFRRGFPKQSSEMSQESNAMHSTITRRLHTEGGFCNWDGKVMGK